tara:strand:+ start:766 stop:1404 length:639 start_codon:yes stop_codon:yes gene_type:complete
MDQDIEIINQNTRIEKLKNFFFSNLKKIIIFLLILVLIVFGNFIFLDIKKKNKIKIAETFNQVTALYNIGDQQDTKKKLIEIIKKNDPTYSPLALYFIIDNEIVQNNEVINQLFDQIINQSKVNKEIKNLIIYKKALFNSDTYNENELLNLLNPIINSDSIWKSHSLYLMAEYFYDRNEREKSKEFLSKIVNLEGANINIKANAQKKLNRDF